MSGVVRDRDSLVLVVSGVGDLHQLGEALLRYLQWRRREYYPVAEFIVEAVAQVRTAIEETTADDQPRQGATALDAMLNGGDAGDVERHGLLTVEEVAEVLKVSPRTGQRLLASGELESVKIGAARRVHRDDLDDYLGRQRASQRKAAQ